MLSKQPDPPAHKADEFAQRLQESLKKTRPRRLRIVTAAVLLLLGLGALAWFYPRAEPPNLAVVAFDEVGVRGDHVILHGAVEAVGDASEGASLKGRELIFQDGALILVGKAEPKKVAAATDSRGEAEVSWTFPAESAGGDFIVKLADKYERGKVTLLPRNAPLCLVQIEHCLSPATDASWQNDDIRKIAPAAGAAATLAKQLSGYHSVYLALHARRSTAYQKFRGWIELRTADAKGAFPSGPVLSRFSLPANERERPWQKTASRLQAIFPEAKDRSIAIAGSIDVAQQFHAAGLKTYYLGPGDDLPAEVVRAGSWAELGKRLEK